jgi:hypothetical protein
MRFAFLVTSAILATGCVPDVHFNDADGGAHDATRDTIGADVEEASADAEGDANGDAADSGDAGTDAREYCQGDTGAPDGPFSCCGSVVCAGPSCGNPQACTKCSQSVCPWPLVCCATGGSTAICRQYDGGC